MEATADAAPESSPGKLRQLRERVSRLAHGLAAAFAILVVEIALIGGFRVDAFGTSIATVHVTNPLAFCVASVVLGKLLAPWRPLSTTPLARCAAWLTRHVRGWRQPRSALVVAVVSSAAVYGVVREGLQRHHRGLADRFLAEGRNELAARHYAAAIGWLDPEERPLRERRAMALWRAGEFDDCVGELERYAKRDALLGRAGYRALWSCYRELGRLRESASVVRAAMATYADLGAECVGVLAQLERRIAGRGAGALPVRLAWTSPEPRHDPVYLRGNWAASGSQSELEGWRAMPMTTVDERTFTADVRLVPAEDYPFVAIVTERADSTRDPTLGFAQFRLDPTATGRHEIRLDSVPARGNVPPVAVRRAGKDGRGRVVAIWPDGGSWFLLNSFVHRGLMPNVEEMLRLGARGDMISTNPPFTATAYVRMVELDPRADTPGGRPLDTLLLQLKGIPFLDALLPDGVVDGSGPTVFSVLAAHGRVATNLVFNDGFMAATNDGATTDGTMVKLDDKALADAREERRVDDDAARWIVDDVLQVGPAEEARRRQMTGEEVFLLGVENSEHKAQAGLRVWTEQRPDFLLLRLPSVDILSHRYFGTVEEAPTQNLMMETYRHLDRVIGRFVPELDEDDTLVLVSDHGIMGTLHHHPVCLLVIVGPGMPAGRSFGTLPIGHLPSVLLSRFGLEEGADRLSDESFSFFFGKARPPGAARPRN